METINIQNIEDKWKNFICGESDIPIIGLLPFQDHEKELFLNCVKNIHVATEKCIVAELCNLLDKYPFSTSIWIATIAAETYANGDFWSGFSDGLGLSQTLTDPIARKELYCKFLETCNICDFVQYYPKKQKRTSFVSAFLFYAGFPICYSNKLAETILQLHRRNLLPHPEDDEAAEILLDLLLDYFKNSPIQMLRRSLLSDAGILVVKTALDVLYTGDFKKVNIKFGDALKKAFDNVPQSKLFSKKNYAAASLRLTHDLTGFEIYCPKQYDLDEDSSFGWKINDDIFRRSNRDVFIYQISETQNEVKVEPLGLRCHHIQTFNIEKLRSPKNEIFFFDRNSLKLKGRPILLDTDQTEIAPGTYWILTPNDISCHNSIENISISKANLLSIDVLPGKIIELFRGNEKCITIKSKAIPSIFLSDSNKIIRTYNGDPILFGPTISIDIWDTSDLSKYDLVVSYNGREERIEIPHVDAKNEWFFESIDISSVLDDSRDILSEITLSLEKNARTKVKKEFLYLPNVISWDGTNLVLSRCVSNLQKKGSIGYDIKDNKVTILETLSPFRKLAFCIAGEERVLIFKNSGIFLQQIKSKPGQRDYSEYIDVGSEVFSSKNELTSIRIWNFTNQDRKIFKCNEYAYDIKSESYIDISLQNLLERFPAGGLVDLSAPGERPINAFKFSAAPETIDCDHYLNIDAFYFKSPIKKFRVKIINLIDGESIAFPGNVFQEEPEIELKADKIPTIVGRNYSPTNNTLADAFSIEIPKENWPEGIWAVFVEVAFSEFGIFEPLNMPTRKSAPNRYAKIIRSYCIEDENSILSLVQRTVDSDQNSRLSLPQNPQNIIPNLIQLLLRINKLGIESNPDIRKWRGAIERKTVNYLKYDIKANCNLDNVTSLVALSSKSPSRYLTAMEIMAAPARYYKSIADNINEQIFSLKICGDLDDFTSNYEAFACGLLSSEFTDCYKGTSEETEDFISFDIRKFYDNYKILEHCAKSGFNIYEKCNILSKSHWRRACESSFSRRYQAESDPKSNFLFVNSFTSRSSDFLGKLHKIASSAPIPETIWDNILPEYEGTYHIDKNIINFASLYAFACRLAGAQFISFSDWTDLLSDEGIFKNIEDKECVLKCMFFTYKEIFAFFIIFWETIIKTYKSTTKNEPDRTVI